jgi:hypothetical protein
MFKKEIDEGVKLLDQEQGLDWPHRIDVAKLNMSWGRDCVIGQLYGHYSARFKPEEGVPYAFDLYLSDDQTKRTIQTREWKEKIVQLRAEREEWEEFDANRTLSDHARPQTRSHATP